MTWDIYLLWVSALSVAASTAFAIRKGDMFTAGIGVVVLAVMLSLVVRATRDARRSRAGRPE